jgi:molybdopterin-guanine dinucleotide biosynthesis protein A
LPDPPGEGGPLGGLVSLLSDAGDGQAIALACDMPFFTRDLLGRLATHAPSASAVAPRRDGAWEPFFARYDPPRALPAARARLARGALSLQGLLDDLRAEELPLGAGEPALLDDWDLPEDVR